MLTFSFILYNVLWFIATKVRGFFETSNIFMLKYVKIWGGWGRGTLFIDGRYKQAVFELTMKNFRLFETEAEHNEAVIEECSVSYVVESNKVYTTPENNGEITFKILFERGYWENDEFIGMRRLYC